MSDAPESPLERALTQASEEFQLPTYYRSSVRPLLRNPEGQTVAYVYADLGTSLRILDLAKAMGITGVVGSYTTTYGGTDWDDGGAPVTAPDGSPVTLPPGTPVAPGCPGSPGLPGRPGAPAQSCSTVVSASTGASRP